MDVRERERERERCNVWMEILVSARLGHSIYNTNSKRLK